MFQLNQLRCFVAVGTELNFRRAAERLNMTQPPLTRQIQALEASLGVMLFERNGRSVSFTAAGERFYLEAQDILRRAESAALAANLVAKGATGAAAVGCFAFATVTLMPTIMERMAALHPGVSIALREMTTTDQLEALSSRIIDLGILRYPQKVGQVNLERIGSDSFALVLHRDHALAQKSQQLTLDDISDQPFIMYSPSAGWHSHGIINGLLIERNLRPDIIQYLDSSQTVLAMVNAGIGVALVPKSGKVFKFDNVVWRDIEMPDHARLETYLAWNTPALENPAVRLMRDVILDCAESFRT